jgi:hypothetical protein
MMRANANFGGASDDGMPGLTDSQTLGLKTLFGVVTDALVRDLQLALADEATRGGAIAVVHELVCNEAADRRLRRLVLAPVTPLGRPSAWKAASFPEATPLLLWRALKETAPALVEEAAAASCKLAEVDAPTDPVYDQLCLSAAQGLRGEARAFQQANDLLNTASRDGAATFASYLDLAPITRAALLRLPDWVGRMSDDRAAGARLAYKDAVELADDAGPQFFEMLFAHLPEPWQILRVMSAIMDHPGDRYVAVSELARFGGYIIDDIDRRLAAFKAFDPNAGVEAGAAAGAALQIAAVEIAEFETSIELSRDGPWGVRIGQQKKLLAQSAEARLDQIGKALDAALPLRMVRLGKGLRGLPKLAADPDPAALRRAEGLMAFFDHSRGSASQSGYGAARAKAAEMIEERLDQYVEDLLEMLRAEDVQSTERIHAFLEVTARFMAQAHGEKAAQIVRRRAAAA